MLNSCQNWTIIRERFFLDLQLGHTFPVSIFWKIPLANLEIWKTQQRGGIIPSLEEPETLYLKPLLCWTMAVLYSKWVSTTPTILVELLVLACFHLPPPDDSALGLPFQKRAQEIGLHGTVSSGILAGWRAARDWGEDGGRVATSGPTTQTRHEVCSHGGDLGWCGVWWDQGGALDNTQ